MVLILEITSPIISIVIISIIASIVVAFNITIFYYQIYIPSLSYINYVEALSPYIGYKAGIVYLLASIMALAGGLIILINIYSRLGAVMGLVRGLINFSIFSSVFMYTGLLLRLFSIPIEEFAVSTFYFVIAIVISIYLLKTPPIAVKLEKRSKSNGEKKTIVKPGSSVALGSRDSLILKVYGDINKIKIISDPEDIINISNPSKFFSCWMYEITPSMEGSAKLYLVDRKHGNIYTQYTINIVELPSRSVKLSIFVNDVKFFEKQVSINETNTIANAFAPFIEAVLGRVGIPKDKVHKVIYLSASNKQLNPKARVMEIPPALTEEIMINIYATEEYKELMMLFGTKSIEELWDLIIKRIQIARQKVNELIKKINDVITDIDVLVRNWW